MFQRLLFSAAILVITGPWQPPYAEEPESSEEDYSYLFLVDFHSSPLITSVVCSGKTENDLKLTILAPQQSFVSEARGHRRVKPFVKNKMVNVKDATVHDMAGKVLTAGEILKAFQKPRLAVVSTRKVDAGLLRIVEKGTLVIIVPQREE